MVKLSIAVMMHPSREQYRGYLIERLGPVPFEVDDGGGIWPTMRRAWLAYDPQAEFHCVVQDDAIVCDRFRERLEALLQAPVPYGLYWGNRVALRGLARAGAAAGYVDHVLHWSVAVCLPVAIIPAFIEYADANPPTGVNDDRLKRFLRSRHLTVRYPIPSLVDHRDEEHSVINDRPATGRVAYWYIDGERRG